MGKIGKMWYNVVNNASEGGMNVAKTEFSGNFLHSIDPKGRATIPTAFRPLLGESFTIGLNNEFDAIALYPQEKWQEISDFLDRIPDYDRKGMQYVRLIKSNSFLGGELDGQGRVLLPQALRQKLKMGKSIRFVGMGRYLEIWDEDTYTAKENQAVDIYDDLTDHVMEQYSERR